MQKTVFEKFSRNKSAISFKVDKYQSIIKRINKITSLILKRKSNLDSIKFLKTITSNEISLLNEEFAKTYQNNLKKIFKPLITGILYPHYDLNDYRDFRVGIQTKYKWKKKNSSFNRYVFYDEKGLMHESKKEENFCFPTRPHQDLANNGYRGSGIMIFYYQVSKIHKDQSNMLFADFENLPKLMNYTNKYGYGNQLTQSVFKNSNWYLYKKLNSKNLVIMDPYTIHCSSQNSNLPRIAFNIKLQPSNYKFLFKDSYKTFRKEVDNLNDIKEKLFFLYKEINKKSKNNNRLNFELAVLCKMLKNEDLMHFHFSKILDFKANEKKIIDFLCGAFLKITANEITNEQIENLKTDNYKIAKYSCAYNLLNTIGVSLH